MESTGTVQYPLRVGGYGMVVQGVKGGGYKKGLSQFIGIIVVTEYGCDTLLLFLGRGVRNEVRSK